MELKQYLKMQQQLVMTPQLQQAIKLLQLSRPELLESIQQELVENPVLEELVDSYGAREARTQEGDGAAQERSDNGAEAAPRSDGDGGTDGGGDAAERAVDEPQMDWERFVEDYNQYSYSPGAGSVRYSDDELPTLEQTLATRSSLADHLTEQLGVTQLMDAERRVGELIIGNIQESGYFNGELLATLAEEAGLDEDEAEAVLEVIQEFDPLGVGARSLRECLLIQVRALMPDNKVVAAIVDRHLPHLEKRDVGAILKDLDISKEELREAVDLISTLEPKPGRGFSTEDAQYITPDVYIVKVGDEYVVQLNEDGLPKLRISQFYEQQIKSGSADAKTKDYIQEKFRSAVWLIRSIHQRQGTIRKVTESIVRFQREFLDRGVDYLRPLILRDVAEDIGMHESTISRVTTNKYVHTPQGTFELKYFFNSRITTTSGPDLASESVKQRIKRMIGTEDPKHPYSDQKLCEMLADEGMEIARRTVAKYREMLNIPSSSKRKKLF